MLHSFDGDTVDFPPDGRYLLISQYSDHHFYAYGTQSGEVLRNWEGNKGALLPGGQALIQQNNKITIYELKSGRALKTFSGLFGVLSDDRLSLLILSDSVFRRFQVADGKSSGLLEGQFKQINTIHARFSSDGKYVAAGASQGECCGIMLNNQLLLWSAADGKLIQKVDTINEVGYLNFSADGRSLAFTTTGLGDLNILNTANGATIAQRNDFAPEVQELKVAFTSDGKQLVTAISGNYNNSPLSFYDVNTGQRLKTIHTSLNGSDYEISIPLHGNIFAAGSQLWRMDTGDPVPFEAAQPMGYFPSNHFFSPDGKLLADSDLEGKFRIWDFEKQTQIMEGAGCSEQYSQVKNIAFSPNGQRVAITCADGMGAGSALSIFQVGPNSTPLILQTSSPWVNWSSEGRYLLTRAEIRDAVSGKVLSMVEYDDNVMAFPTSQAISPDSTLVVLGYADGTLEFYSLPDGKKIASINHGAATAPSFSPDGKLLALGGRDGTVKILWIAPRVQADVLPRSV